MRAQDNPTGEWQCASSEPLPAFLKTVEIDERKHVSFLRQALGAKAAKKPKFDFMGTNKDQDKFRATAQVLENTGVHA